MDPSIDCLVNTGSDGSISYRPLPTQKIFILDHSIFAVRKFKVISVVSPHTNKIHSILDVP